MVTSTKYLIASGVSLVLVVLFSLLTASFITETLVVILVPLASVSIYLCSLFLGISIAAKHYGD